jgi:DNA-binding NarL/FixJ family response regulator
MLATEADDLEEFERIKTQLWSLGQTPSRYALALSEVAEALIMSRIGRFTEAWRAIRNARIHVDTQRSAHKFSVELYSLTIRLREAGCAIARYELPALLRRERVEAPKSVELSALALGACVDFASGDWGDALAKLDASDLSSINHTLTRTRMQSIPAAIAALTGHAPARADLVEDDVATALRGALWARAAPLALWWAAFIALTRPRDAARLIQPLRAHLADPLGAEIFHFPMAAALYAMRADRALLAELSDPLREEHAPWHRAQQALAAGLARHALGRADGAPLLHEARSLAYDLGARFLAAYAADHLSEATPAEAELLRNLGVDRTGAAARRAVGSTGKPHRAALAVPTVREIQVAELVEEGYSNRQVAEALVLSERTIEAHITNLFNKLQISSRTQLARWIVERRAGTIG